MTYVPSIRPVWSESLLCTQWVAKDPMLIHADSEDSDQTERIPRLIWVFAGRTGHFVSFVMRRLKWFFVVVLRFNTVNTIMVMLRRSVDLSTLFLGRPLTSTMHLSMFSPRGVGGGRITRRNFFFFFFENLGSNSLPMSHKCVSKLPWTCLKLYIYILDFHYKVSKVPSLCQGSLSNSQVKRFLLV